VEGTVVYCVGSRRKKDKPRREMNTGTLGRGKRRGPADDTFEVRSLKKRITPGKKVQFGRMT